ncbi:very short patch repair endonuclease [Pseudomonas syringae]|uniref:very short patch repair endonuclease n=1 Tax=Pseudomonas syringae TaxID=317 RepID=UPI003F85FC50
MTDVVDSATRSRMMAGIQGKNTSPELLVRKALHARGFRYRIHAKHLPGKPDLVLPKYSAVIFIHGCFWHGHDCRYFKVPKTRPEFWLEKIAKNRARDLVQIAVLEAEGWKVLVVWECAVRYMKKQSPTLLIDLIDDWLRNGSKYLQVDEVTLTSGSENLSRITT